MTNKVGAIVIGKYCLRWFDRDHIYIRIIGEDGATDRAGEGGAFKEIDLELALDRFWNENF